MAHDKCSSVWRNGVLTVMQIIELRLVLQNMSSKPLTPKLNSISVAPFDVLDMSYGTLFQPRWIAVNGTKCAVNDDSVVFHYMDFGVVSVYVSCPNLEFEDAFLSAYVT